MEWQPIETAPKDGTDILIWAPMLDGRQLHIAHYDETAPSGRWGKFCWQSSGDNGAIAEQCVTHWMPLPPPPQDKTP